MLRVLVICGSTHGRQGYVPPELLAAFLEVVRLRTENRGSIEILLHDDSPLTREESVEEFCTVRPWPEIREMFASAVPGSNDLVIVFEHRESGAAFAELADTIHRVREQSRPPFTILFVCDSRKNEEDAWVAWSSEVPVGQGFTVITCHDDGTGEHPISVFVAALVDAALILSSLQPAK